MTSARTLLHKRSISLGLLGLVAAGAMFASGVLVANATMDDDAGNPSPEPANSANIAGVARDLVAPAPDAGFGEGKGGGTVASPGMPREQLLRPGRRVCRVNCRGPYRHVHRSGESRVRQQPAEGRLHAHRHLLWLQRSMRRRREDQ